MKLDYIIIYQKSGLPIYSNCFSGFCTSLAIDDALLSGFLSALSTMPDVLGQKGENIQGIDLNFLKLCFNHTTPSGHVICLGMEKSTLDETNYGKQLAPLFKKVEDFIESEYGEADFDLFSQEERQEFGKRVVDEVISPSLKYLRTRCSCGDTCQIISNDLVFESSYHDDLAKLHEYSKKPVWERIGQIYSKKYNFFKKAFYKLYTRIYIWNDNRLYKKNVAS
ncbi:MAG: hypothetical protein ACXADA_14755 [Candidatus Hodarchaeales archaeon]|jgi:hypothetical protein